MTAEIKRYYQIHCPNSEQFIDYVEAYGNLQPGDRVEMDEGEWVTVVEEITEREYMSLVMKVNDD